MTGDAGKSAREQFNTTIHAAAKALPATHDDVGPAMDAAVSLAEWLGAEILNAKVADVDRIACRKGCAWCCYQQVGVTAPQVFHIADALKNGNTAMDAGTAQTRLAALDATTRGMDRLQRLATATPCAFLEDGECTIYDVRPFACRGANSVDAELCRRTVEDLDNLRDEWKASGAPAWIHAAPFEAMQALQDGLIAGMAEEGYAVERLELTAAVLTALELPDAEDRWRAGEDVFRDARLKENAQP